jgi:hypothetical protein
MAYTQMLEDQVVGKNDSWAVRWHASWFLRGLLILYPGRPLAQNIGQDGSGTHATSSDDSFNVDLSPRPIVVGASPSRGMHPQRPPSVNSSQDDQPVCALTRHRAADSLCSGAVDGLGEAIAGRGRIGGDFVIANRTASAAKSNQFRYAVRPSSARLTSDLSPSISDLQRRRACARANQSWRVWPGIDLPAG